MPLLPITLREESSGQAAQGNGQDIVGLAREVLLRGSGHLPRSPGASGSEILPIPPGNAQPAIERALSSTAGEIQTEPAAVAARGRIATFQLRLLTNGGAPGALGLAVTGFVSDMGARIGPERVTVRRMPGEGAFDVEVAVPADAATGCYFGLAVVTGAEDSREILRLSVQG